MSWDRRHALEGAKAVPVGMDVGAGADGSLVPRRARLCLPASLHTSWPLSTLPARLGLGQATVGLVARHRKDVRATRFPGASAHIERECASVVAGHP